MDHVPRRLAHRGRPGRCWLVIIPLRRPRQRFLHTLPVPLPEPIEAVDHGCRTGVDPAVERLVTPPGLLLPRAAREALDDPGDQPLGGELLEVLLTVPREVTGAGRIARAFLQRLLGGPFQLEPAVQLALGDRRADRPDPQTAALAASSTIAGACSASCDAGSASRAARPSAELGWLSRSSGTSGPDDRLASSENG